MSGLGPIGKGYQMPRHRMRWTLEGINASGEIIFPRTIVLVSRRPFDFAAITDENGGKIVPVPSNIVVTIQTEDMASVELSKEAIKLGCLCLWSDYPNQVIEAWHLTDVQLSCWGEDIRDESFELTVEYKESKYVKLIPTTSPNPEHTASSTVLDNSGF